MTPGPAAERDLDPLAAHLHRLIAAEGPIPVARFMAEALSHPEHGYYMRGDPLGAAGDFITAPEISQAFGELIGLWAAVVWRAMGRPQPLRLVELGPGRGTLMADALRAAQASAADFRGAIDLHLVETSPALRAAQRDTFPDASWHDSVDGVDSGPAIWIANEFFDALPVHQLLRTASGWRERLVDRAGAGGFRFVVAPQATPALALIPDALAGAAVGCVVETCPAAREIVGAIARRLVRDGGAALVIDYGHAASAAGETLQAVRGHRFADPLVAPGRADLTAHVDFQALGDVAGAAGARVHGPIGQGAFLRAIGIEARRDALIAAAPERAVDISARCKRLIDDAEMGSLFKAMAITHPELPVPPGFET